MKRSMPDLNEYQQMFEILPIGVAVTDSALVVLDVNAEFCRVVGVPKERLVERPIAELGTSGLVKYLKTSGESMAITVKERRVTAGEMTIQTATGITVIRHTAHPILDDEGRLKYVYITYLDLTEQAALTDQMADRAAWYESILDAIKNPITVTDMNRRWTFVNKAVADMLNVDRKAIMGHPCSEWGAGICNTSECGITRLLNGFENTQFEQGGGYFNVDTAYVVNAKGERVGHVEVVSDISRVVKTQKYMAAEIDGLIGIYQKMAAGDLTPRYELSRPDADTVETHAQIEKLRDAVRGIIGALQINIREVNRLMTQLTSESDAATHSIHDALTGVQHLAESGGKVGENMDKVAFGVGQISQAMQDMSAAIEEITSNMESVSLLAKEANDISQKGATQAGQAEKSMAEISDSTDRVYGIVDDVEKQMGEISKIVLLIRELASQTNLLALNAAIEAARAGEAGRGFAVVAAEVKSLAQESRNSAERIEEMIGNLKQSTQNASTAMQDSKGVVEQGARMVTETLQSFNKIALAVEQVARGSADVAATTEEQAATTEEITASIHEVSTLVDHTAKEAAEAAGAAEESTAALDEITRMVEGVNAISVEAMEMNRQFKVE
jgi:methyl-accepting chemotaxis protein